MTTEYFDRNGISISRVNWHNLRPPIDDNYSTVREYDDDRLKLAVIWDGRVENSQNYMPNYRPIFRIECWNRTLGYEGDVVSWAKDPVMDGVTFPTEKKAVLAYEAFLEQWTDSNYEVDKAGNKVFREAINKFTPPDPDAPSITDLGEADIDEVGAW